MRVVKIPNVGDVAFPDYMDDDTVRDAASKLHEKANPQSDAHVAVGEVSQIMQALASREQIVNSEQLKRMANVAKTLEENPGLVRLAIAGLRTFVKSQ